MAHLVRRGDPDVVREQCVQCASQVRGGPLFGHPNPDCLAARMHAGIGPTRTESRDVTACEARQHPLQLALHGALVRLTLPTREGRAVVVQHELHGARRHRSETSPTRPLCQANRATRSQRSAEPIDFARRTPQHSRRRSKRLARPPTASHFMSSRNLPSLAHALSVAPDYDAALVALGEGLADVDRTAHLGLLRYDARREMLRDRLTPNGGRVTKTPVETTFDHLPATIRMQVAAGGQFVDLGDHSAEYAPLFGFPALPDGGILSLRGVHVDGCLAAVVALYEQKKMFGTRSVERFAPFVALFELGYARLSEREARDEAVRTLEDVTQRVHGEYVRASPSSSTSSFARSDEARAPTTDEVSARIVALEREVAKANEAGAKGEAPLPTRSRGTSPPPWGSSSRRTSSCIGAASRSASGRARSISSSACSSSTRRSPIRGSSSTACSRSSATTCRRSAARSCSSRRSRATCSSPHRAASRRSSPRASRIAIGQGVAGRVAQAREPLLVQDVDAGDVAPAAARPAFHDRLVHQLSARLSGRPGRRGEPHESRAVRRVRGRGRRARAPARRSSSRSSPRTRARDAARRDHRRALGVTRDRAGRRHPNPLQAAIRRIAFGDSLDAELATDAFGTVMRGEGDGRADRRAADRSAREGRDSRTRSPARRGALRGAMVRLAGRDRRRSRRHVRHRWRRGADVQHLDGRGAARGRRGRANREARQSLVHHAVRQRGRARAARRDARGAAWTSRCARSTKPGITFMFAPAMHPAMRHVGPVRRELGIPTVMNIVGPLANPAGAARQVVGVAERGRMPLLAGALAALGASHALVVHGEPGMDEISPLGPTHVVEVRDGAVTRVDDRSGGLRVRRASRRAISPAAVRRRTRARSSRCWTGKGHAGGAGRGGAQRRRGARSTSRRGKLGRSRECVAAASAGARRAALRSGRADRMRRAYRAALGVCTPCSTTALQADAMTRRLSGL